MATSKTKTATSTKTVEKSKTSTRVAKSAKVKSAVQKALVAKILSDNGHVKKCACCEFEYVPMIAKVKGMEELLNNICPGHEPQVLKSAASYLNDCIEGSMSLNRKELEQIISEARGEETYDEESDMNLFNDEMDFGSDEFRFSGSIEFDSDSDDFAA